MKDLAFKISDSEALVMKAVWSYSEPVSYSQIRAAVCKKSKLKSQVIQSYVNRLVEKGVLQQEQRDVYYYSATVPESDYKKAKTRSLVSKVFDGDAKGLLTALITFDEISWDDLKDLRDFWEEGEHLDE